MADLDPEFIEALKQLKGKRVKVVARQAKDVDKSPGAADALPYFLVTYYGIVLDPPVRPYPETSPNGTLCLYIQEWFGRQTPYACAIDSIEEVDDEIPADMPVPVGMSALTNPHAST